MSKHLFWTSKIHKQLLTHKRKDSVDLLIYVIEYEFYDKKCFTQTFEY